METPTRGIVTPEAVVLEFETAGLASRALAFLLDLVVIVIALWALSFFAAAITVVVQEVAFIVQVLIVIVLFLGYPVALESLTKGRTVGKMAMGLRVVTIDGGPERFRHAATRALLGIVELWLTMGAAASVSVLSTRRDQRVGDLAAGTMVIRERVGTLPAHAVAFHAPWGYEGYVERLDVAPLTPVQYGVVRSFLLRVGELSADARAVLGTRLANAVVSRIRAETPPGMGPEVFLACVAAAYQQRHGGPMGGVGPWLPSPPPDAALLPPPPAGPASGIPLPHPPLSRSPLAQPPLPAPPRR